MTAPWHALLTMARRFADAGQFFAVVEACRDITRAHPDSADAHVDAGVVLVRAGLLSEARRLLERAAALAPDAMAPLSNLSVAAREAGAFAQAREAGAALLARAPDSATVRRNHMMALEYDPEASDAERLDAARAWGAWAQGRAGGPRSRPDFATPLRRGRPLRVGYVSADFCNHTVGLLVKDVLAAHDPARVTAFAYAAGERDDEVTRAVRAACVFRDVSHLDDAALARTVRRDGIDVLVDLSGHTAGSRLTAFAYRPAPVMVSWLGYFATTGLACLDAVLMDEAHAPPGAEALFVEPLVRLPRGRLCFTPPAFAPEVAPPPHTRTGHVTFGSFNNTAKLNDEVLALWAAVLRAVPDSRLVLKWRTFNDPEMAARVRARFAAAGVAPERVDLRGPSVHAEMLMEYGDIDIALDPTPFTGGMTSCEALWMGVPVVTWPRSRVVSRQTFAFLSAIGLADLAARDADDYVRIAAGLAADRARLAALRRSLRDRMAASPLCDVRGFTAGLEDALWAVTERVAAGTVALDGCRHSTARLSETGRARLARLHAAEREIAGLRARIGIARTARAVYQRRLKALAAAGGPARGSRADDGRSLRDGRSSVTKGGTTTSESGGIPAMAEGQTINIDGVDYVLDDLSEGAKTQLANLHATDQELARLQTQFAIAQTARAAYADALKEELENMG